MKLYSFPLSPFTAKVRIALYEKELPFEKINVPWDAQKGMFNKPAEMLAINPKGQVPVLIDGEIALYDSTVIFEYLEEQYPEPALYPIDPAGRARCRLVEDTGDTLIAYNAVVLIAEIFRKRDPATRNHAAVESATAALHQTFERLDRELKNREYLCGAFSVADIACYVMTNVTAYLGVPPRDSLSNITKWFQRMQQRPSVQRELREMAEGLSALPK